VKQLNVPLEDEVYNAAKIGAATAGVLLKDWVAQAIKSFSNWQTKEPRKTLGMARAVETDAPGELTIDLNPDFGA
jgi:hypothetical protein